MEERKERTEGCRGIQFNLWNEESIEEQNVDAESSFKIWTQIKLI